MAPPVETLLSMSCSTQLSKNESQSHTLIAPADTKNSPALASNCFGASSGTVLLDKMQLDTRRVRPPRTSSDGLPPSAEQLSMTVSRRVSGDKAR
eukprot:1377532-Pleurochrysis_carterae.AAC.11